MKILAYSLFTLIHNGDFKFITSTNAVTWTQSTTLSAATYSTPKAIAAANDLFLIVSDVLPNDTNYFQ